MYLIICRNLFRLLLLAVAFFSAIASAAEDPSSIDFLRFAQGAVPVSVEGSGKVLKVGIDHALLAIDGDHHGFSLTPKPGAADTKITFIFQLPALTTFSDFAIPNILETLSPSQTFVSMVEIAVQLSVQKDLLLCWPVQFLRHILKKIK